MFSLIYRSEKLDELLYFLANNDFFVLTLKSFEVLRLFKVFLYYELLELVSEPYDYFASLNEFF
jgi:hypothetical protein